jgi:pimeloyl-ACP methyl ester carboxylesterase
MIFETVVSGMMFPLYGKVSAKETTVTVRCPNPKALVVYCHGNAETISSCKGEIEKISQTYQVSVIAIEYQGYHNGKRPLTPNVDSINREAGTLYQEILRSNDLPVILWGRSIGSAVAGYLADTFGCDKLILVTPLAAISPEMFKEEFESRSKIIASIILPNIPRYYDNVSVLKRIDSPVLIIAATDDVVLPPRHPRALKDACPKAQLLFVDAGHNNFSCTDDDLAEDLALFIDL